MMEKAMERAERIADVRKADAVETVAARLREAIPGVSVDTTDDDVTVSGRGLLKQWLDSANLRFFTDSLR